MEVENNSVVVSGGGLEYSVVVNSEGAKVIVNVGINSEVVSGNWGVEVIFGKIFVDRGAENWVVVISRGSNEVLGKGGEVSFCIFETEVVVKSGIVREIVDAELFDVDVSGVSVTIIVGENIGGTARIVMY